MENALLQAICSAADTLYTMCVGRKEEEYKVSIVRRRRYNHEHISISTPAAAALPITFLTRKPCGPEQGSQTRIVIDV
jgi:hypothetical protein